VDLQGKLRTGVDAGSKIGMAVVVGGGGGDLEESRKARVAVYWPDWLGPTCAEEPIASESELSKRSEWVSTASEIALDSFRDASQIWVAM
jgi:hypothetical protein